MNYGFGTCSLLFFIKKIVPRLYDVDVSTFTAQKKLSLQSNFGTNWASLLRKKIKEFFF